MNRERCLFGVSRAPLFMGTVQLLSFHGGISIEEAEQKREYPHHYAGGRVPPLGSSVLRRALFPGWGCWKGDTAVLLEPALCESSMRADFSRAGFSLLSVACVSRMEP